MRFIVLRSTVTPEGTLALQGLASITQKASGVVDGWIELAEAKTNCINPEQCDLLSFDDKEQLQQDLDNWGILTENVVVIGVEPD